MDEPTTLFDSYEHDFNQLINDVKQKLDVDSAVGKDVEARKAALRRVELILDEADEMISQMQLEIQGIPKSLKSKYTPRLKNSQAELLRWKKLSREVHGKLQRGELFARSGSRFGGVTSDEPYGTADDRTRLLVGHEVLEDGTRRLQESERVALETEEQGAGILSSLRRQREQIENSRDVLHTADTSIDRASSTLKRMIRRMYQQRAVIASMIVVLIVVILLILWAKLWR
ncbi:hypothetical protein PILCRDRAFT_826125 [Piloderma croceum F 1598]|uniref:Vesicle transport v-SNARE N-terminal domain-containing protein n=1 Tax=Piloderma croceum (strain F 1598) TaxID=765440 RepID=A0A0C3BHB0_PILCF|nr:hypothetical protein PILCRDRAFT_826125 [Piloderma croceum F 1598]